MEIHWKLVEFRTFICAKLVFASILILLIQNVNGDIGGHLVKAKRHVVPHSLSSWAGNNCKKFRNIFKRKGFAMDRLDKVINKVLFDNKMSKPEKYFQVRTFQLFQKELNESESLVFQSLTWLDNTLKGDYKDLMDMMESTKARLDALKDATLKEQEEYNELRKAEKVVENRKVVSY